MTDEFQPSLTYPESGGEATTGHSGTDTSRAQATDRKRATMVQSVVLGAVTRHGTFGLTIADLRRMYPQHHHGSLSSALTNLHRDGRLARLVEKRDRCHIYVVPDDVNGRATQPAGHVAGRTRKAGAQDQPAVPGPQTADLGIAEWVYAAEMTEAFEQGFGLGVDKGWQTGYDQGVEAAQERPGAVLDAKHVGIEEGRRQQAARTMALISNMRQQAKGRGAVHAHTTMCWTMHPLCAIDAIAKAQVIP